MKKISGKVLKIIIYKKQKVSPQKGERLLPNIDMSMIILYLF